jgi:shikimate dehydrogenase
VISVDSGGRDHRRPGSPLAFPPDPSQTPAFEELGLDWVYVAFEVPDGDVVGAFAGMRALGLAGLSVTMPHKTAAVDACDEVSRGAAQLQSVNTVTPLDNAACAATRPTARAPAFGHDRARRRPPDVLVLGAGARRAPSHTRCTVPARSCRSVPRHERAARAVERVRAAPSWPGTSATRPRTRPTSW